MAINNKRDRNAEFSDLDRWEEWERQDLERIIPNLGRGGSRNVPSLPSPSDVIDEAFLEDEN